MGTKEEYFERMIEEFSEKGKQVIEFRKMMMNLIHLKNTYQEAMNDKVDKIILDNSLETLINLELDCQKRIAFYKEKAKEDMKILLLYLRTLREKGERISVKTTDSSISTFLSVYHEGGEELAYVIKLKPGDGMQEEFMDAYLTRNEKKLKHLYEINYIKYIL